MVAAEPSEAIGKGDDDGRHALFPDQPVEPFRQVFAEADPIRMRQAAAGEADKIHQQGQSLSVMPSRDVHIDDRADGSPSILLLRASALDSELG